MKSVNTNFLGSLLIIISHGAHEYAISANQLQKGFTQSAKIKNFLTFHARKTFFQAHFQSCIDYASTLWDSASESLLKPLKSLHRRAIRIVLLKHTSLTNEDYKNTTLLPLKPRLMCKKARFMHKILSGKAPTYLLEKVSINHYSRNCSRKFNVPTPRLDLFKSSLMYSGPTLWNFATLCTHRNNYCVGFQN